MFDEEPYCQNDLEGEPLDWSTVSFYDALRHYPRSIISVSDFEMRRIRTKLTPVIYTGAKDYNFFGEIILYQVKGPDDQIFRKFHKSSF